MIWRFDPIILGDSLTVEHILKKIERVAQHIYPYTEKCVFSFVDWYKKTEVNLRKFDSSLRVPNIEEMKSIAKGIVSINNNLKNPMRLATCAETIALENLGIEHNKCIDPELILRLCPHSPEIHKLCGGAEYGQQLSLTNNIFSTAYYFTSL